MKKHVLMWTCLSSQLVFVPTDFAFFFHTIFPDNRFRRILKLPGREKGHSLGIRGRQSHWFRHEDLRGEITVPLYTLIDRHAQSSKYNHNDSVSASQ